MSEETIVSVFQQDHQEIDQALEQYRSLKHSNVQAAKDSFKRFLTGLQRHIVWEEELLFPVWERKSGMTGGGPTQITLTPPGPMMRLGGGPYTVALAVTGANRLSTISLTIAYDPALVRVLSVQEGTFMRAGGAEATFVQQAVPGRVDITITRSSDATGATGCGLLGAVQFDALAPGSTTISLSGTGMGPGGTAMGLQFRPVTVAIR